jgi:hypothetical protein
MKNRTLRIILGAIIAIVLVGISAKPLLIKYHLYKFSRASALSRIFDHSETFDPARLKADTEIQGSSLIALNTLGYLYSYSIPLQSPRADAEDAIGLLAIFCHTHKIPALATIENEPSGAVLHIIDKPENRSFWDTFVRMYIEKKE